MKPEAVKRYKAQKEFHELTQQYNLAVASKIYILKSS
jgi:hypothetical protein